MWNKEPKPSPQDFQASLDTPRPSVPQPVASPAHTTVLGKTMQIKGDIFSEEAMSLNGEMEGRLEVNAPLTIGPSGKVKASVKATEIVVDGTVHGNVEAVQRIVLRKGAHLVGDVKTAGIVIEDGAYFKGGIDITQPKAMAATAAK